MFGLFLKNIGNSGRVFNVCCRVEKKEGRPHDQICFYGKMIRCNLEAGIGEGNGGYGNQLGMQYCTPGERRGQCTVEY